MKTTQTENLNDDFGLWLETRHKQLLAGGDTDAADVDASMVDSPLAATADMCLRLLEKVRRNRSADSIISPADETQVTAAPEAPRQIGRFRIERELGRGGGGVVLLAFDPKLGRQVALKVPGVEVLATESLFQRFVREAEAAARLQHANVVAVYEVGREGPVAYIASEYCRGGTLVEWFAARHGQAPVNETAELFAAIADGLHHAHQRGVLHRDLKPSNVVLDPGDPPDPSRPLPKLADFGLAKVLEDDGDLTRTGMIIGTANYMAPEQASGAVREIGVATDIFGLGCMLYEALVGQPPFAGANRADTMRRLLTEEPVPPRRLRRDLPADLEAICRKCLEKRPADRYGSAAAVAEDLRRLLRGEPTRARPLGRSERALRWARRHRHAVGAASAIFIVLAISLAAFVANQARLGHLESNLKLANETATDARRSSWYQQQIQKYSSDMAAAFEAWHEGDVDRVRERLVPHVPDEGEEDLRSFPWKFLDYRCNFRESNSLYRHQGAAFDVTFSADGKWLASASFDHSVILWDRARGAVARTFQGHTDEVNSVTFSPDSSWLASTGDDGTVRVWSINEETPPRVLHAMATDWNNGVVYSPDGSLLVAGGKDGKLWVWNTSDYELVHTLPMSDVIESLAFSPTGDLLALACQKIGVRVLKTDTFAPAYRDLAFSADISPVCFSPDGQYVVGCSYEGELAVHSASTGRLVRRLPYRGANRVHGLAIASTEPLLAVCDGRGEARIFNLEEGTLRAVLTTDCGELWSVAFDPRGEMLLFGGNNGEVRAVDLELVRGLDMPAIAEHGVQACVFSSDGNYCAGIDSFYGDGRVALLVYDVRTGQRLLSVPAHHQEHTRSWPHFDREDRIVYIPDLARENKSRVSLRRFDLLTGAELSSFDLPDRIIYAMYCSPDNREVLLGTMQADTCFLIRLDAATGAELSRTELGAFMLHTVIDDGRSGLFHNYNYVDFEIRDLISQQVRLKSKYIDPKVTSVCISQDGRYLSYWCSAQPPLLFDLRENREYLVDRKTNPHSLAITSDSKTLFVGYGNGGEVRCHDLRTGRMVASFPYDKPVWVKSVAEAPGGRAIAISRASGSGPTRRGELDFYHLEPYRAPLSPHKSARTRDPSNRPARSAINSRATR